MSTSNNITERAGHFGEILRAWRQRAGLTLEAAAEKLGVSRAGLIQWEQGRRSVTLTDGVWRGVLEALGDMGLTGGASAAPSPPPETADLEAELVRAVREWSGRRG